MRRFSDFRVAVMLAQRARFLSISSWFSIVVVVAVFMAAQFSGRQPATVALDVGLSVIRLGLPVIVVLLLQELFSVEFDRRFFLISTTYPRPRYIFLLGRFFAVLLLVLALLLVLSTIVGASVMVVQEQYEQATPVVLDYRYFVVIAFLALDILAIAAVGTLLAVTAKTPSFVLIGTLGFMLAARSFSAIVALLQRESYLVPNSNEYQSSLNLLGYVLPDLAALDVRMIALYGQMEFLPYDWPARVIAILGYVVAMLAVSVWSINRKRFA